MWPLLEFNSWLHSTIWVSDQLLKSTVTQLNSSGSKKNTEILGHGLMLDLELPLS